VCGGWKSLRAKPGSPKPCGANYGGIVTVFGFIPRLAELGEMTVRNESATARAAGPSRAAQLARSHSAAALAAPVALPSTLISLASRTGPSRRAVPTPLQACGISLA
jgi:hypothetical protein